MINLKMCIASFLMFVIASMDVAYGLRESVEAFIRFRFNPTTALSGHSHWFLYMKTVDYVLQTFIGEGVLVRD